MNLISCDKCGVVIDKNKLTFPDEYDDEDEGEKIVMWSSNATAMVATAPCPVCGERILER